MASLKPEKPACSQSCGQVKKEPAKAPASKQAPNKVEQKPLAEQKPREPKKKSPGSKPAAKN